MLKKIGLASMLAIGMLALAHPPKADAAVRFGVSVGAPVYSYPVDPYYGNGPTAPYPNYYNYPGPAYVAPSYVAPYYGWRDGDRDRDRHEWREHERHVGRDRDGNRGWRR